MLSIEAFESQISGLVHPSARQDEVEHARHLAFVVPRLLTSLLAVCFMPAYLAVVGVPSALEVMAFGWAIAPLFAVWVVARSGNLPLGQVISLVSLMGLAVTVGMQGGITATAAMSWLILMPIEAVFSFNRIIIAIGAVAATVIAICLSLAAQWQLIPNGVPPLEVSTAMIVPAIVYALGLALSALSLNELRHRLARVGAERYRTLSEAIGDLVMHHDRGGAVLSVSNAAGDLFNLGPRDLLGRGFFERVHVADRPSYLRAIAESAASDQTVSVTLRLRSGETRSIEGDYAEPVFAFADIRCRRCGPSERLRAASGASVVSVVRDVTASKRHEAEIERARAEAERANRWKDRFLANVSHELRTPLNAIIGFSEMLASPDIAPREPAKQREYAGIIHSSGEHLLSVVNTILDMSKIEAGSFVIEMEPFAPAPLVRSVCDMMQLRAERGGVRLVRDIDADVDEVVGDKRACRQVLINLLSNAVKFTPAGGEVRMKLRPEGNSIVFTVCDTGIGIQASDLPHLGDAFFQARATYDRPYEGTGLGLSLVRGLIGLQGGAITVASEPGRGTEVTVRLPLDCRAARRELAGPARIEVLARHALPAPDEFPSTQVKKIA